MSTTAILKGELHFSEELYWVLDVMKRVAASELKRLEKRRSSFGLLAAHEIQGCLGLLQSLPTQSVLFRSTSTIPGVLVVTSNTGFVGDLNIRVVRAGLGACHPTVETLFVMGDQGRRILQEQETHHTAYPGIENVLDLKSLSWVLEEIVQRYLKGNFSKLLIVYPKYHSVGRQEVVTQQMLPVAHPGKALPQSARELVLESPLAEIEHALANRWVGAIFHEAAWNSKLSELAGRTIHLEGASEELTKQNRELTLQYFRAHHEEMDQGVREVYASLRARKEQT